MERTGYVELETLNYAAEKRLKPPRVIEIGLNAIKARPVLTINGQQHFDAGDVCEAINFLDGLEICVSGLKGIGAARFTSAELQARAAIDALDD